MPLPTNPLELIVPVVTATPDLLRVHDLLGTGFFVAPGVLMSAKHVLGVQAPEGQQLAAVLPGDPVTSFPVRGVHVDPAFDIAVGLVEGWPTLDFLRLAQGDALHMNIGVLTTEFSPTESRSQPGGMTVIAIGTNWHQGHIVREYTTEFGHARPTHCIDLSYPAFRGASGAPVVLSDFGDVVGMVVANVERHLLPAHLERIERRDGDVEHIQYFLPNAQAIRASHLRAALAQAREALGIAE